MDKNLLYRSIPKVDVLLEDEKIKQMIGVYGRDIVIDAIRVEMNRLREFIAKCDSEEEAREQVQKFGRADQAAGRENFLNPNMKKSHQCDRNDSAHEFGTCTDQFKAYETYF